jgi:hypothetical protein
MDHAMHGTHQPSLNRVAFSATTHCLTGCSIGEILGMVIGNALSWGNWTTVALSVVLAFMFGYALTMLPLLRAKMPFRTTLRLALAADTISIAVMEIIDNAIMLIIPGAMEAGLSTPLFWGSLIFSLFLAGLVAFPINRWLIARGQGHTAPSKHHSLHGMQTIPVKKTENQ